MGLDILPRAGAGFRASCGAGNFKYKFSQLTRNQGSEFGNLRNNPSIVGALQKYSAVIKSRGGLSRLQQKAVIRDVKKQEGVNLTWGDKQDLKKVVGYYARDAKQEAAAKASSLEEKVSATAKVKEKPPVKVRINRDPNSGLDFGELRNNVRPGVAARINKVAASLHQGSDKSDRGLAVQKRIKNTTGVSGPVSPTPLKGATQAPAPGAAGHHVTFN